MNLRGIVAVSGKSGLYKLIGQNKVGYILESLDAQKLKIIANLSNTKLAALEDITVYGEEHEIKLAGVLENIAKAKTAFPDLKADTASLRAFFLEVAPEHDQERVYASDMKKILSWYLILKDLPLFTEKAPDEETVSQAAEEQKEVKPKAAPKAKPAKAAKPANAKAPTGKAAAPAKKATMNSKRGG